jgi:hypothetical protein
MRKINKNQNKTHELLQYNGQDTCTEDQSWAEKEKETIDTQYFSDCKMQIIHVSLATNEAIISI